MRTCMIILAAALAAVVAAAAGAGGGQRWADVRDDAATAPDIADVSAASDDNGLVTLTVAIANRTALDPEDELDVGLDADRQAATGRNGLDYVLGVYDGTHPFALAWSEQKQDWALVQLPTYRYAWDNGVATFTIDRRDLGWTSGFEFYVGSWDSGESESTDYAPAIDDRWTYSLRLPFALRLVPNRFDLTEKPKAGKTFTLGATVVREDTGETLHAGAIACRATAGGKRLVQSSKPRFFRITILDGSGDFTQALCAWKVPKAAKGKALRAVLTVSLSGQSVTRTYSGAVR